MWMKKVGEFGLGNLTAPYVRRNPLARSAHPVFLNSSNLILYSYSLTFQTVYKILTIMSTIKI